MKRFLTKIAFLFSIAFVVACGDQKPYGNVTQVPIQDKFESVAVKLNSPAFGAIDGINDVKSPKLGSIVTIKDEKIVIAGNYVDAVKGDAAAGIVAMIDGKPYVAIYGGERPDIAKALNNPKFLKSQFYLEVPTAAIGLGLHELKIRVIASDKSGYYESDVLAKIEIK